MTNDEARMTSEAATPSAGGPVPPGRPGSSSLRSRHSLVIRASSFVIPVCVLALGCGPAARPPGYGVTGRVLDAETKQPVASARVLLRVTVPTGFDGRAVTVPGAPTPTGGGLVQLSAYGLTGPAGVYDVDLPYTADVLGAARQIRVEASKAGYQVGTAHLPAPPAQLGLQKAADILLVKAGAPPVRAAPGAARPGARPGDGLLPWK